MLLPSLLCCLRLMPTVPLSVCDGRYAISNKNLETQEDRSRGFGLAWGDYGSDQANPQRWEMRQRVGEDCRAVFPPCEAAGDRMPNTRPGSYKV